MSGWVTKNIHAFVKQKHWTENTINDNKCELSKGTDFVSLLYAKTNIDAKVNKYRYTVFRKSGRKFPGRSLENNIFTT